MRRSNWSLTIAICLSLCVHEWLIHEVVKGGGGVYFGPFMGNGKTTALAEQKKKEEPVLLVELPATAKKVVPNDLLEEFGQPNGRGAAINAMEGKKPLRAKQAPDDQASLSRHPGVHRAGEIAKPQAIQQRQRAVTHGGNNGAAAKMLEAVMPKKQESVAMVGLRERNDSLKQEKIESLNHRSSESLGEKSVASSWHENKETLKREIEKQVAQSATKEQKPSAHAAGKLEQEIKQTAHAQQEPKPMLAAGNGGGNTAGEIVKSQPALAGDPGEKSDSDSDAFSNEGSAVFEAGRLEARFGRRVRTVRPNFPLVSQMDLTNLYGVSVQLEVHTDTTGKPTEVEVIQSSGLNTIDEPVRLAMYDWWFEPPKDRHGKPQADVSVWTIWFR